MNMDLDISITGFSADIKPVIRDDQIKAFVTWIFRTNYGNFKIYGGTIRLKEFGKNNKALLTYDPPAYKSKGGYNKSFFIDNLDLYKKLCKFTLSEYCKETGELPNNYLLDTNEDDDSNNK